MSLVFAFILLAAFVRCVMLVSRVVIFAAAIATLHTLHTLSSLRAIFSFVDCVPPPTSVWVLLPPLFLRGLVPAPFRIVVPLDLALHAC